MKFYEIKFLVEPGTTSGTFDQRIRTAAAESSADVEIVHTTIHARPSSERPDQHDAAVFIGADNRDECFKAIGRMARMYGAAAVNIASIGEKTLTMKGDRDAEREALLEALGMEDDEEFTITEFEDIADQ